MLDILSDALTPAAALRMIREHVCQPAFVSVAVNISTQRRDQFPFSEYKSPEGSKISRNRSHDEQIVS